MKKKITSLGYMTLLLCYKYKKFIYNIVYNLNTGKFCPPRELANSRDATKL